jgi:hypothetical protein
MRMGNPTPTFTETLKAASLQSNQGGIFTVAIDSIPQFTAYQALYKQYRINSLEVIIVPRYKGTDLNVAESNAEKRNQGDNAIAYWGQSRIAVAVNQSAGQSAPTSELDVLKDNGCRVKVIDGKPMRFYTRRPVPNIGQSDFAAPVLHTVAVSKSRQWLDIDSGPDIMHHGISFWTSQAFTQNNTVFYNQHHDIAEVFYKVSFSLKDPR